MTLTHAELVERNKKYTMTSWTSQGAWNPISMAKADGIYFWDADGKQYLDWSSQLINVNVGHGNDHVIKAVQEQVTKMGHAYPGIATEMRARLGQLLSEVTPAGLNKSFFTIGGADAVENAMKMSPELLVPRPPTRARPTVARRATRLSWWGRSGAFVGWEARPRSR